MLSYAEFLSPDYYQGNSESSLVIIFACLVAFLVGLLVSALAIRKSFQKQNASLLWCGLFSLAYAAWNIVFLSAYAQRDLSLGGTSLSAEFAQRLYVALSVLLPSIAHACLRRIYHSRFLISNRLHFVTVSLAILSFTTDWSKLIWVQFVCGLISFSAFIILNMRIWRRYRKAQDLRLRTRSLFLGMGMSVAILFSLIGQLRAEGLIRFPVPYLGNIITVIFIYFIYQMIENPRLREIRELMLRGIRVVFLTATLSTIFISLLSWVGTSDIELFLFNTFLASFLILTILDPLQKQLDRFIIRKLIVDRYEFEKVIHSTLRKVRRSRSIGQLISNLLTGISESDRVFRTGLYLWDPNTKQYRLTQKSTLSSASTISLDHPIVDYFVSSKEKILQDPAETFSQQKMLREFKAHIIFSVFLAENLAGLWIIRSSLSETNPYTSFSNQEIELLSALVQELAASLEQLRHFEKQDRQQRLAALGEMSAALAHEIRNPLGAIQGATQLLSSSPTLSNSEDQECVQILTSEIDRLQRTVDQYLQFARKPEASGAVSTQDLLKHAIKTAQNKALKTGTQIHFDESLKDFQIFTDALKLEQVVVNLITNSCEAFSKNVWLKINELSSSEIEIQVQDDGPGIPADILPNIFTPLFTTKRAGSGLGLPICKKIIDSLGGDLSVKSKRGEGSCFSIRLSRPLQEKAAEPIEASIDLDPTPATS